jgi:7-dehydrocholesterol reductase
MVKGDGSVENAYRHFYKQGLRAFIDVWPFPSPRAWKMVLSFVAFEAFLLVLLPGERFLGPSTPAGNRPHYTVPLTISNFPSF